VRDFYYDAISRVRAVRPNMPVMLHDSFRPYRWGTMMKNWPFDNLYMDNHAYHGFNIADIASDTPEADRQKQYTHEKIGCSYKSQLHFQTCNVVPVMVGEFSLAIDNCMPHLDARYADYGQCKSVGERLDSPWWDRHIKSFAMRQISTYERELGWAFWTYKLEEHIEDSQPAAYFWSYRLAVNKGYVDKSFFGNRDACLYAPIDDFALGDLVQSSPAAMEQASAVSQEIVSSSGNMLTVAVLMFVVMGVVWSFKDQVRDTLHLGDGTRASLTFPGEQQMSGNKPFSYQSVGGDIETTQL
jgi:hypothetical protein